MKKLALLMLPLTAACDAPAAEANNSSAPTNAVAAAPEEKVLKSETVEAVFTGWEVGDYVWANLRVNGAETGAWVGPPPLEHFLEAHRAKPITVRIHTVSTDVPEAGGEMEISKIVEASAGTLTAAQWWAGLSREQREEAERRMEEVLGGGA